jgi:hypothetical protein
MKGKLFLSVSFLFFVFSVKAQIRFAKTYGVDSAAEGANAGQQTSDGGYILAGVATPSVYEIVKTDSAGDTLWTKSIQGKTIYSVHALSNQFGKPQMADTLQQAGQAPLLQILIYPNPSNAGLTIQNNSGQQFQFTLYNSSGEKVIDKILAGKTNLINLSAYSKDIYFYRAGNDVQLIKSGMLIKQ